MRFGWLWIGIQMMSIGMYPDDEALDEAEIWTCVSLSSLRWSCFSNMVFVSAIGMYSADANCLDRDHVWSLRA